MGKIPSLTGEFLGGTHRVLECTQTHPPGNQHQKGPICFWIAGEVTESWQRAKQAAWLPLGPLPTYSVTMQRCGLPGPGEYLRLRPLLCKKLTGTLTQKISPKLKDTSYLQKNYT